jgi:multiple sugar transport system ATP-binding protein
VAVPTLHEDVARAEMLCGVRPEDIELSDDGALRAQVLGAEYLGSCQIVTLQTAAGALVRAKVEVNARAGRGDQVGLRFAPAAVSLFDRTSGRALRTARDDVSRGGRTGARHG